MNDIELKCLSELIDKEIDRLYQLVESYERQKNIWKDEIDYLRNLQVNLCKSHELARQE